MTKVKIVVEQLKAESKEDFLKFRAFIALGETRTLDQAYKAYYETEYEAPARWLSIADRYRWLDRATEYDKTMEQAKW